MGFVDEDLKTVEHDEILQEITKEKVWEMLGKLELRNFSLWDSDNSPIPPAPDDDEKIKDLMDVWFEVPIVNRDIIVGFLDARVFLPYQISRGAIEWVGFEQFASRWIPPSPRFGFVFDEKTHNTKIYELTKKPKDTKLWKECIVLSDEGSHGTDPYCLNLLIEIKPNIGAVGPVLRQMNAYRTYCKGVPILVTRTNVNKTVFESQGILVYVWK